jgi:glyoxylase-like metal-dependent hydrolase (beta-lactamase superfamily II)
VLMPEHDSAATEHALLEEITAPLSTLPDDPVRLAADVDFPIVLRGYDRIAVDAYVKQTAQLVAELQATRSPEAAVRRALERVGEQISGILQRAHDTAEQITALSRSEAEDRLEVARQEAAQIRVDAESKVKELDVDADRIWAERHRILTDIRKLSDELQLLANTAVERFPPEPAPDPEGTGAPPLEPLETVATRAQPATAPIHPGLALDEMRVIDLMHLGRERVIGCWQVGGVLIDPGPGSCLETLLAVLGGVRPRALLLTHIHLDHAGASGSLARMWPDLEIYVHERGAPHLVDPSRLLDSARRLYGEDMNRLWGEFLPVPESQLRILSGGESLLDDRFEVLYTPGHASHHVSYLTGDTAFVGDVGGVRITSSSLTIPPTPPPEIDVDAWHDSIEKVRAWAPARLAMTHFGDCEDVEQQLEDLDERLDLWAQLARTEDRDSFVARVMEEIAAGTSAETVPAYVQAAPPEQLYAGLDRYWRKRGGSESRPETTPLS